MTLEEFQKEFEKLRKSGWVKSKRSGNTGIGHTLEVLMGLPENNLPTPDLGLIELKSRREFSSSLITLFTTDKKAWKVKPLVAIHRYGLIDENNRPNLYRTMSLTRTAADGGLFLSVDEKAVHVEDKKDGIVASWDLKSLAARFEEKFPQLLLVTAKNEQRTDGEWFHYTDARLVWGTSPEIFRDEFAAGRIYLDLRLHDGGGWARNHGTGFRVTEQNLARLFANTRDLG